MLCQSEKAYLNYKRNRAEILADKKAYEINEPYHLRMLRENEERKKKEEEQKRLEAIRAAQRSDSSDDDYSRMQHVPSHLHRKVQSDL